MKETFTRMTLIITMKRDNTKILIAKLEADANEPDKVKELQDQFIDAISQLDLLGCDYEYHQDTREFVTKYGKPQVTTLYQSQTIEYKSMEYTAMQTFEIEYTEEEYKERFI